MGPEDDNFDYEQWLDDHMPKKKATSHGPDEDIEDDSWRIDNDDIW